MGSSSPFQTNPLILSPGPLFSDFPVSEGNPAQALLLLFLR